MVWYQSSESLICKPCARTTALAQRESRRLLISAYCRVLFNSNNRVGMVTVTVWSSLIFIPMLLQAFKPSSLQGPRSVGFKRLGTETVSKSPDFETEKVKSAVSTQSHSVTYCFFVFFFFWGGGSKVNGMTISEFQNILKRPDTLEALRVLLQYVW